LVIWTILLASGLVLLALALKRGEIRSNIQTFVYVGILLIEIGILYIFFDFFFFLLSHSIIYFIKKNNS